MNNTREQRTSTPPKAKPSIQAGKRFALLSSFLFALIVTPLPITANNAHANNQYTTTMASKQAAGHAINKPSRGMEMSHVESQFGYPVQNMTPSGTPPIARWIYEGFTVYFEHQYVIHSVQHRQ
ncbi:MAG: hypothetical protein COB04_07380 [Gammaproteobacteria bacterium]|nr:MAG: hypothetical protein COB04_07380 [Gammaproteobacteria bacterium]